MSATEAGGSGGEATEAVCGPAFAAERREAGGVARTVSAHRPRRLLRALTILLALLVAAGVGVQRSYPGMTDGLWHQMRYASFEESANLWYCIRYFLDLMEMLRWDPQTQIWSFRRTPEAGLDDRQRSLLAFHRGEYSRAIALLERHLSKAGESEDGLFWLAMDYMRRAEAENCLAPLAGPARAAHDPAAYCSLPLRSLHERRQDSRRAMQILERLLDRYGADNRLYLWLLNFSAMTVGDYPQEVPARFRIRTPFIDTFYGRRAEETRRRYPWLHFTDRARDLGVESYGTGRGVAVEDFDRDGNLDLVTASMFGNLRYYRNEGGKRFAEATEEVGLGGVTQPLSLSAADYDNDGWIDLLVLRPFDHYRLFRNVGGRFIDVTESSGLLDAKPAGTIAASWFAAWGDIDNDGDLDLFVSSWAFRIPLVKGLVEKPRLDSKLFVNDRGRFRDATAEYGLADLVADRQFIGTAFGDYNGDGWPDLFLSGPIPGTSVLLRNVAGRRFVRQEGIPPLEAGFTAAFLDVNQDGRLDVFQGGFNDARTAVARAVFGARGRGGGFKMGSSLFLVQTPDGRFEKHADLFDDSASMSTMGTAYGDLDNDGCFDFYLGTGDPEPWFILPNLMYRGIERDGQCTGRMENISMLNGFGTVQKGHGIVFFDFDGDGDQDIFSTLGGMWPADVWVSQLFVNESDLHNQWTKIRLRGRRTNYYGVGVPLAVIARRPDGRRLVRYRQMDNGTGFGSAPYLAHVGLLDAVAIEGVEVYWPASRCRQTYPAALGRLNVLDEADCLREQRAPLRGATPADGGHAR
jgi:hypothetical protein